MRIESVELHRVGMPLVRPFVTSFGRQDRRDVLLIRVRTDGADGWGECVAMSDPFYSSEYVDGAQQVIERYLAPAVLGTETSADDFAASVAGIVGHRMAKTALEAALLDAELRTAGRSLAERLGSTRDRVECGVSVGIASEIPALLDEVRGYLDVGYHRIKLKIEPGRDIAPVEAVRELVGDGFPLQVDANTAYTREHVDHLRRLDAYGLLLIEQPFDEEDIASHVILAETIETPVCLDESVLDSRVAADLIDRGATSVVNIKAGRVGGYLEAVRVHDVARARDVPVWCGGMLESGIGRAANVALAALPGFTLPGDTSASDRYFAEDITEPFVLEDGTLAVPEGPGIGVTVREDLVSEWAERPPTVLRAGAA